MRDPAFPPDSPVNWPLERLARFNGILPEEREAEIQCIYALIEGAAGVPGEPPSLAECARLYRTTMTREQLLGFLDSPEAVAKREARYRALIALLPPGPCDDGR